MEKRHFNQPNDELESKWNTIKVTFIQEYSCLSPHDLDYPQGEFDTLLQHIGEKTGMTPSRLKRKITRWDDAWLHFF